VPSVVNARELSTAPDDAPPRVLAGRYLVHGEIGRGGCAIVYDGVDSRLGRPVAIKIAQPEAVSPVASARLTREARAAGAISHPNVCAVSDTGTFRDGRTFLVMERLHGQSLHALLSTRGLLSPDEAIDIAVQLLSALDASHSIGIVHRDVKPDNVFLATRAGCPPVVKLLDFGLCCINAIDLRDDVHLTHAGHVVGTPEYMAPEQVSGSRAFDGRVDVYAVGVLLYEMVTGRRAFGGADARTVARAVLAKPVRPLCDVRPGLPVELERIVGRAMARQRSIRYEDALELQSDLLALRRSASRGPRAAPRPVPAPPSSERRFTGAEWDAPTLPNAVDL
jgi:serine/threonine-protein kinase